MPGRPTGVIAFLLGAMLSVTAQISFDQHNNPYQLTVVVDGKTHVSVKDNYESAPLQFQKKVKIGGFELTGVHQTIQCTETERSVSVMPVSRLHQPDMPEKYDNAYALKLRSHGGLVVGSKAFWIFSWDNVEAAGEHSSHTFLFEVTVEEGGVPSIGRSIELEGLGPYQYGLQGMMLGGQHLAIIADGGFGVVDLAAWKQVFAAPPEGNVVTLGGSRIYWGDSSYVSLYEPAKNELKPVVLHGAGRLIRGFSTGIADVFIAGKTMVAAGSQSHYVLPGGTFAEPQFFVVPGVGIGVIDINSFAPEAPGVFLSLPDFRPLASIRRGKDVINPPKLRSIPTGDR